MTTPQERTRAMVFARELLQELKSPGKHPETTLETRRAIDVVLRHFPEDSMLDYAALEVPELFSKVSDIPK